MLNTARLIAMLLTAWGMCVCCTAELRGAQPSANADRRGNYTVHTTINDQYNYHVGVPDNYDPTVGAGIHLFFHGQGRGAGVESVNGWMDICKSEHLIAINMQYLDGDNLKDTGGKVKAAMEAVEQVIADYHIIPGRGVICSHSGGGLPHSMYVMQSSRAGPGPTWPFTCMALYGSNYWTSLNPTNRMCYFIGLGENEWGMGLPTLGNSQLARARELFVNANRIGYDFVVRIEKGKGHSISGGDKRDTRAMFHRFDLANNPFVYEPQFTDSEVRSAARLANRLRLGPALDSLKKTLAQPDLDATKKQQAELLQTLVQNRADEVLKLAQSLAEDDPLLFGQYQRSFSSQLSGTPQYADWKLAQEQATKKGALSKAGAAAAAFCQIGPQLFNSNSPQLNVSMIPTIQSLLPVLGENSSYGKMLTEYMKFAPTPNP